MAKRVNVVGAKPKRIRVVDKPQRRIEPADVAAALGAGKLLGAIDKKNLPPLTTRETFQ